ncbi:S1 family peptidase [Umezawaea sp. Da 62-37]|uniref:S1 family peptidase n=1 Tax=Umezawaea sp. Da 62-37 TaxID=3075927 RepID=UPI0028F6CFDA|nr:S1 family peptidase [Umezawaea sp. Da 62-37]WNV88695.1 S1 family peptidase [Umezawaea sp. Da 62-37]
MIRTSVARVAGATVLAAITLVPGTAPAHADQASSEPSGAVLAAYKRDLGLDADQAKARLEQERTAAATQKAVVQFTGGAFGGAWFDEASGKLVVGVTDPAKTGVVKSLGAEPKVVTNSEATLAETKDRIDRAGRAPASVTGWYVDGRANAVVVTVKKGAVDAEAQEFLDVAKAAGPVSVVETDRSPRLYADVVGGDAYLIDNAARCSIGFAVSGGFVSAGHCGSAGASVTSGSTPMGTFEGSSFPGNDYSYVKTSSGWTPSPTVDGYDNPDVTVTGSTESAVGASVCRSGSTTGWHCGTVQAKDQTVNYQEGSVSGLTLTNACAEPGDSGGSWVSGTEAQGVTSGGSGDCTSGGETYFQPVNEILSVYGVSLITG